MARARKKAGSVKVNFKDVESRRTPPEGDYVVEVTDAQMGVSGNKNDQIEFTLEVAKGEYKGTKLWLYCPLQENSLWKLHAFLTALGEEVPDEEMEIDLPELIGKQCLGVLTHEKYNGKNRAKMTDFDTLENYKGGDEDGKDKKFKKDKKGGKDAKADKAPNYSKMDEDDLRKLVVDRGLADKKAAKKLDDDDMVKLLEKDDKKSAKGGKDKDAGGKGDKAKKSDKGKKAKKYDADDIDDMDEDELKKVVKESGIKVDLKGLKLKKQVAAVKDALEEADLLNDD